MPGFVYFGSAGLSPRSSCFATTGDANASRAGNQGFLAIGDWLKSYGEELKELFEVKRIPSYSTIRRALLGLDYEDYSARLASFFEIKPLAGETLALDGKALRGSYLLSENNPYCEPHKAITLVTAYLVERGLILKPEEVENKSNEMQRVRADRRLRRLATLCVARSPKTNRDSSSQRGSFCL